VNTHAYYGHNEAQRVRAIINGMSIFVLNAPTLASTGPHAWGNFTMLEDAVESSQETCTRLVSFLNYADTLPPDQLPLEVPLVLYGERMRVHQCGIVGSFEHVRKIDVAGIPCGVDANGAQILDPVAMQPPVVPAIPPPMLGGTPPVGPVPGNVQDPNTVLTQGMLTAMQAMTQVNLQVDAQNTSMAQQQMQLQAATMRTNAQQLAHLTSHMGNLGTEVGEAIASHPTRHAIQATLSHPNAMSGQSNDPRHLGSLTRTCVGMSVPNFNYGPYVQAFQPQPNDKNTRRIDKATHQIIQRHLPPTVKVCYDAAHASGVALPVSDFIHGFQCVVETQLNGGHQII